MKRRWERERCISMAREAAHSCAEKEMGLEVEELKMKPCWKIDLVNRTRLLRSRLLERCGCVTVDIGERM